MEFFKFLISTIFSILYTLLLEKHVQSHIANNYKVINKNKMSCNTLCPCIPSFWEQYSKILHNIHFDHVIWYHNAFCIIFVWKMSLWICCDIIRLIWTAANIKFNVFCLKSNKTCFSNPLLALFLFLKPGIHDASFASKSPFKFLEFKFFDRVYHTRNLNQKTWTDLDGIEMHPIFFQLGWNLDGNWPIRKQNPYQRQFVNVECK
jgi:hypothetical protein